MQKLYLSFDIEADGPSPYLNNMLSFGISGITQDGKEVFSFQRNLSPLYNKKRDEKCMSEFWDKNPEAWKFVNSNMKDPVESMREFSLEFEKLKKKYKVKWVAYPSAYDWQWIKYYYELMRSLHPNSIDIGYSAICISTMFQYYSKKNNLTQNEEKKLWQDLIGKVELSHDPLDDARVQGQAFLRLCKIENILL